MKITLTPEQHAKALAGMRPGLSASEWDREAHVRCARFAFQWLTGITHHLQGYFVKPIRTPGHDLLLVRDSVLPNIAHVYDASGGELNHEFLGFVWSEDLQPEWLNASTGRYAVPVDALRPMSELPLSARRAA